MKTVIFYLFYGKGPLTSICEMAQVCYIVLQSISTPRAPVKNPGHSLVHLVTTFYGKFEYNDDVWFYS
jgi:hypothetical protein